MLKGFWRWLARRSAKFAGIPLRDPALVAMFGQTPVESGEHVDEISALNCSAVYAAINVISQTVASLPCLPMVQKDPQGSATVATGLDAYELCTIAPNPCMTPMVFFETLQAHAMSWGNGYAQIEWRNDRPKGLWPMLPNCVTIEEDEQWGITYKYKPKDGAEEVLAPWEVLHVPGLGFDGLRGYGVVQLAREGIGLALATERAGASLFGRGTLPGGVLTHPGELTPTAEANLRKSWEELHRGPGNTHRVAILTEGMNWTQIGLPPEQAQFLQTRLFQIAEIARWFNIPPHLLRDLSHATFSNIEHQSLDFLIYTLRGWLVRWQQELRRKLFHNLNQRQFYFAHKVNDLLKADRQARYNAYNTGRMGGWLTLNDILREEDMPLIVGGEGDKRLMPLNMGVLGEPPQAPLLPLSTETMAAFVASLEALKPVSWELGAQMFKAVYPQASPDLINAVLARLSLSDKALVAGKKESGDVGNPIQS
jgi:HK97 family phage portal protein